jgi:hypothetical protein
LAISEDQEGDLLSAPAASCRSRRARRWWGAWSMRSEIP